MPKRTKKKKTGIIEFSQMSIDDFEVFCGLQLNELIRKDRCKPVVKDYGAKTFGQVGLREEGYGIVIMAKDGSSFVMKILPFANKKNPSVDPIVDATPTDSLDKNLVKNVVPEQVTNLEQIQQETPKSES